MNVFDFFFQDIDKPNDLFVAGSRETATFNQIKENSLKVSFWINKEIGQDKRILLICPNSVYFISVYLGIMKSGNVCVPINPAIEQDSLEYICRIADVKHAFIYSKLKLDFNFNEIKSIDESGYEEILDGQFEDDLSDDFDGNQLAQILFTSGSTGYPKGVMLSHKNLIANTTSIIQYLNLNSSDRMEVVLPFYYCYGLSLLHTHLKAGGSIVLNNNFIFIGSILNDLKKYKCTGFAGVPSHFQILFPS